MLPYVTPYFFLQVYFCVEHLDLDFFYSAVIVHIFCLSLIPRNKVVTYG